METEATSSALALHKKEKRGIHSSRADNLPQGVRKIYHLLQWEQDEALEILTMQHIHTSVTAKLIVNHMSS